MGASKAGIIPRTNNCYRKFDMEPSKNHQQVTLLEKECRMGLKKGALLCMDDEPDYKSIVTTLSNMLDDLEKKGMEGVFIIVLRNGTTVNMLKKPAYLTEELVDRWLMDLTRRGVHNGFGGRHLVCPYDLNNLAWSFDCIMDSLSSKLATHIEQTCSLGITME